MVPDRLVPADTQRDQSISRTDTFITVAEDCPVRESKIPPIQGNAKTTARMQYEMISDNPYRYTSDDVMFEVFTRKKNIPEKNRAAEREKFFSKGQPCMRASALADGITQVGPIEFKPDHSMPLAVHLSRSVTGQQLSVQVARSIWDCLLEAADAATDRIYHRG